MIIIIFFVEFMNLSGFVQDISLNVYWLDIIEYCFLGLPFIYLSMLKVCHIGLFLCEQVTSKYLVLSTFVFWLFIITQVNSLSGVTDCITLICVKLG